MDRASDSVAGTPDPATATKPEPVEQRSVALAALVGVGAALALFVVLAILFTIPLFALARFTEPAHGTGREWFRDGLRWAAVAAAGVATIGGAWLAWWLRRGGRIVWPSEPGSADQPGDPH